MIEELIEDSFDSQSPLFCRLRDKINELIDHINDLEAKLLSAEELLEAEDIEKADEALKKGKFSNFKDLPETFGGSPSGSALDPGININ